MAIASWLEAGAWGLLAGSALVIGAAIGHAFRVPPRAVAGAMAFGSGVLISALSFELVHEAFQRGGFVPTAGGFLAGGVMFTVVNVWLSRRGAGHRKRSGHQQAKAGEDDRSSLSIALGALLDSVPESIVIGLSLLENGVVNGAAVAAVFLSNVPEGLSSASGMKNALRTKAYIFGVWSAIALASGVGAIAGFILFENASDTLIAATSAVAAGAILAMLVETMIPEAFSDAHELAGLIAVLGFLCAFGLGKAGG